MENYLYKVYAEVDEILVLMESKYIEKIQKKDGRDFEKVREIKKGLK